MIEVKRGVEDGVRGVVRSRCKTNGWRVKIGSLSGRTEPEEGDERG